MVCVAVEIYTGLKFGKMTVIKDLGNRIINNKSRRYYLCVCECGNKKEVGADCIRLSIKNSANTTCRFCNKGYSERYLEGTRIHDIRGKKFGKLTVIDFDWDRYEKINNTIKNNEKKSITTYWICKCDCGKEKSIRSNNLKSGDTKSCGCHAKEMIDKYNSKIKTMSFEQWCIDNEKSNYIELWDYALNDKKPSEINYKSSKKYYFKCTKRKHKSELYEISKLTTMTAHGKLDTILSCRACNSAGQYLLDTYGNLDMWADVRDPFGVSKMSNKKYLLKCQDCGEIKNIILHNFVRRKGIGCVCGDGFSYPNKFMFNMLTQLKIDFETEYSPDWIKPKRYDFYIPSKNLIIEVDGGFHYKDNRMNGQTKEESKSIDDYKNAMANINGIDVVRIDCSVSKMEYIKNNINKSKLMKFLSFKYIDWIKCEEYALKNITIDICNIWNTKQYNSVTNLSKHFKLSKSTIRKHLHKGNVMGWCDYNPEDETKKNSKRIFVFKDGVKLGEHQSGCELSRISKEVYGVKFTQSKISATCRGEQSQHNGFVFKYA